MRLTIHHSFAHDVWCIWWCEVQFAFYVPTKISSEELHQVIVQSSIELCRPIHHDGKFDCHNSMITTEAVSMAFWNKKWPNGNFNSSHFWLLTILCMYLVKCSGISTGPITSVLSFIVDIYIYNKTHNNEKFTSIHLNHVITSPNCNRRLKVVFI